MMQTYPDIATAEASIIEEFSLFDSWEEKYEYLIDLGKKLPPIEASQKTEENIVRGCQSTVWLSAVFRNGRVYFFADSDAIIVKGLISMLIRVLSGNSPEDIVQAELQFIDTIGMHSHLAQTRSNGLRAMIRQMKNYALAFQAKQESEK